MARTGTTKDRLMKKAGQLFLKNGYEKTSMRDLAKAVGIQAPGIYNHFKSKKEILTEINKQSREIFCENVLVPMQKIEDPEKRIRWFISTLIRYQVLLGEIVFLLDDNLPRFYVKGKKEIIDETFHLIRDSIRELQEQKTLPNEIDPTVAAFSLIGMMSRIYKWYDPKGRLTLEELVDQTSLLFLKGLMGG